MIIALASRRSFTQQGAVGVPDNFLFPISSSDRVILNLNEDPLHSVAVNWRTDTAIVESIVHVAEATHGPDFLGNVRVIEGTREQLVYKSEHDPEVTAYFHSAMIEVLEPGGKYVYCVGSEQGCQYLGLLRLVVFGKAVFTQLVFFEGLKI